jgi:hypothetical protein
MVKKHGYSDIKKLMVNGHGLVLVLILNYQVKAQEKKHLR